MTKTASWLDPNADALTRLRAAQRRLSDLSSGSTLPDDSSSDMPAWRKAARNADRRAKALEVAAAAHEELALQAQKQHHLRELRTTFVALGMKASHAELYALSSEGPVTYESIARWAKENDIPGPTPPEGAEE